MDGMNEKGLCVAVLMIEGRPGFDQNTEKPGSTITTTVRLLLDKAGSLTGQNGRFALPAPLPLP